MNMKAKKAAVAALSAAVMSAALVLQVYANSSWVWLTDIRPYWLLPAVAIITLFAESFSVIRFGGIRSKTKAAITVTVANLISFAAPYAFIAIFDEGFGVGYYLEHTPFYTVGFVFLLMTLACEFLVVYNVLKKDAADKKSLMRAIIMSNIATTVFVGTLERMLCYGRW